MQGAVTKWWDSLDRIDGSGGGGGGGSGGAQVWTDEIWGLDGVATNPTCTY
jgi:hypothetical protein